MSKHNFRKLRIWQYGISLVNDSYRITKEFPVDERYGLISQMNRCAVSIPSNIAEGTSKGTTKHFKTFLEHSLGSAFEWETQLIIAKQQSFISEIEYKELQIKIVELQNMIYSFKESL